MPVSGSVSLEEALCYNLSENLRNQNVENSYWEVSDDSQVVGKMRFGERYWDDSSNDRPPVHTTHFEPSTGLTPPNATGVRLGDATSFRMSMGGVEYSIPMVTVGGPPPAPQHCLGEFQLDHGNVNSLDNPGHGWGIVSPGSDGRSFSYGGLHFEKHGD